MTWSWGRGLGRRLVAAIGLGAAAASATAAPPQADAPGWQWPGGARAAISLAYDDGLASHLDHVLPALQRRGLRASFYLPINSPTLPQRQGEWRQWAALGHELGNHSLFHHCSAQGPGRSWVQPDRDLDRLSPAQVQAQVLAANTWLQALDGQPHRSFTPPCLDIRTGGLDFVQALQPAFVAYRARPGALSAEPATLDPYAVGADAVENLSGAQLIALAEAAAHQGGLLSLTFHGVGAEYLQVSREAHDALLDHLAQHRATYWTDSFVNVMTHVRQQQAARRAVATAPAVGGSTPSPGPAR